MYTHKWEILNVAAMFGYRTPLLNLVSARQFGLQHLSSPVWRWPVMENNESCGPKPLEAPGWG